METKLAFNYPIFLPLLAFGCQGYKCELTNWAPVLTPGSRAPCPWSDRKEKNRAGFTTICDVCPSARANPLGCSSYNLGKAAKVIIQENPYLQRKSDPRPTLRKKRRKRLNKSVTKDGQVWGAGLRDGARSLCVKLWV